MIRILSCLIQAIHLNHYCSVFLHLTFKHNSWGFYGIILEHVKCEKTEIYIGAEISWFILGLIWEIMVSPDFLIFTLHHINSITYQLSLPYCGFPWFFSRSEPVQEKLLRKIKPGFLFYPKDITGVFFRTSYCGNMKEEETKEKEFPIAHFQPPFNKSISTKSWPI